MNIRATVEIQKGGKTVGIERSQWVKIPEETPVDSAACIALGPNAKRMRREAADRELGIHRRD